MTSSSITQLVTFHLEKFQLGIDVMRVQEVLLSQETTDVPLAPGTVRGLINLRGLIIPAIDLRRRLRLPDRAAGELSKNVVIQVEDETLSLLVDEIGEVVDVSSDQFEQTPVTLGALWRDILTGVYKLEKGLLLQVNPDVGVECLSKVNNL